MFDYRRIALTQISRIGGRFLPFADVATAEVPLARLLRLSLFQVSVGMALVLLYGTLNRVMIVELGVPATIVAAMLALPLVFAPFRTLIGFKSDNHRSALGWRRVPYIWRGTLLQFGGFAVMPFALLVLSGFGESGDAPRWIGISAAALSFLLVGAGAHMVQTVGLALATDLMPERDQPRVVGLMYVMFLLGMAVSALIFGWLLRDYSPLRLIQVIQGVAVVTVVLNMLCLWKQEARDRTRAMSTAPQPEFREAWAQFAARPGALRLMVMIGLGTAGFGMADVLMEPYGGQVLGMTVSQTTQLTAVLAGGGLLGFAIASKVLMQGVDPTRFASLGALIGLPAFAAVILAAFGQVTPLFVAGTFLAGFGAALFSHGTLVAAMRAAPREQVGLALGSWGAVQATCMGIAVMVGGLARDLLMVAGGPDMAPEFAYIPVFAFEMLLLVAALAVAAPFLRMRLVGATGQSSYVR
ncbi:MAG: PucC family protein [Alkalilacustris sp.]